MNLKVPKRNGFVLHTDFQTMVPKRCVLHKRHKSHLRVKIPVESTSTPQLRAYFGNLGHVPVIVVMFAYISYREF